MVESGQVVNYPPFNRRPMADFAWNSRKLIRIFFESRASFRLHRSSKKEIHISAETAAAKLLDLSAGGCGMESAVFVPAGARLNIFLDRNLIFPGFQKTRKRHFSKIVGVVRSLRQLSNRKYRLGIQFEKISTEDKKLIDDFVILNDRRENPRISFPQ